MKILTTTSATLILAFATLTAVSQDSSQTKTDKSHQDELPKADGLKKISSGSREWYFDVHIDHAALKKNIEVAIENAMKSVEALEKLEINIDPIEINLKDLNVDINPVIVNIPDPVVVIDPIEVNIPEIDIDADNFRWNRDDNEDEDNDADIDNDNDHHRHSVHDYNKYKEKHKDKDKSDDKNEKTKGLKKINWAKSQTSLGTSWKKKKSRMRIVIVLTKTKAMGNHRMIGKLK